MHIQGFYSYRSGSLSTNHKLAHKHIKCLDGKWHLMICLWANLWLVEREPDRYEYWEPTKILFEGFYCKYLQWQIFEVLIPPAPYLSVPLGKSKCPPGCLGHWVAYGSAAWDLQSAWLAAASVGAELSLPPHARCGTATPVGRTLVSSDQMSAQAQQMLPVHGAAESVHDRSCVWWESKVKQEFDNVTYDACAVQCVI